MPETLIEIDLNSAEPLYRQVQDAVRHGIASGTFSPRRRLPSSRELAEELGVSRNTINMAYQELLAQGVLVSRERRGIFVNEQMPLPAQPGPAPPVPGRIRWSQRLAVPPDQGVPDIAKPDDWSRYPYPFIAGQVEAARFPARAWLRCLREALDKPHLVNSLEDAQGGDDRFLVAMVQNKLLPSRGVTAEPAEILITIGSQHGLDLIGRALLGPGRRVLMEDPGYLDARHIFLRTGARVEALPVDGQGALPPASLAGVDVLSLTPSHHHPTNVTLSMERRRKLLAMAAEAGTVVLEDDYDSEFRYQGRPSPSLKSIDRTGDTVYLGTFSKFLSPGLRLGYLVGPPELLESLRAIRRYSVRHPSGHLQRAMALFIESGDYHRTLRLNRSQMKLKWQTITAAVREHLPWAQDSFPSGGVSLWITGPEDLDSRLLAEAARARGVLIEPGDIFFMTDPPRNCFRLGYGAIPLEAITPGVRLLGETARQLTGA